MRHSNKANTINDNPAVNWFVVPNRGHSTIPPDPGLDGSARNANATHVRNTRTVEKFMFFKNGTLYCSPISDKIKRCKRIDVSSVVAANATTMMEINVVP